MPYMYILKCADDSFYTGSTVSLEKRLWEHQNGLGANHTKNRLPVRLVFCEEFAQIDEAFYREKQIQGWNRAKKQALIDGRYKDLPVLALSSSAKTLASTSLTRSPTSSQANLTKRARTLSPSKGAPEYAQMASTSSANTMLAELVEAKTQAKSADDTKEQLH